MKLLYIFCASLALSAIFLGTDLGLEVWGLQIKTQLGAVLFAAAVWAGYKHFSNSKKQVAETEEQD